MTSNGCMLNAAAYNEFQRSLLERKGGNKQISFLRAVQNKESFLELMDAIPKDETSSSSPVPTWKFTSKEFKNLPACTEEKVYDHWINLNPSVASRPGFWAQTVIDLARTDSIAPATHLAGPVEGCGHKQIEEALITQDSLAADACVRRILRRMSGISDVRGNRSVFSDCTLARAWWRERLVRQAERKTGIEAKVLGTVLRHSKEHWESLVTAMVSRSTVFGNTVVQNAFVASLANLVHPNSNHNISRLLASDIRKACQSVCIIGSSIELPVLDFDEIQELMENLLAEISNTAPNKACRG